MFDDTGQPADLEQDPELAAITSISRALSRLQDVDARRRVLSYVLARFTPGVASNQVKQLSPSPSERVVTMAAESFSPSRELPGIARLSDDGTFHVTVRDLKARSGLDAAVRLAHVAIYAHHELTGVPLSSSKGLTPILKAWRLYDGNTRARLAKEKGIVRNGDQLSLDAHATRDAQRFITEILDDQAAGSWRPR